MRFLKTLLCFSRRPTTLNTSADPSPLQRARGAHYNIDQDIKPPPPYDKVLPESAAFDTIQSSDDPPEGDKVPEDSYDLLSSFDTIFLIDDSASMSGGRWNEVCKVLEHIAPICTQHDKDGIDVYFLNHTSRDAGDPAAGRVGTGYNVKSSRKVHDLFDQISPSQATPTGRRLGSILNTYLHHFEKRVKACDGDAWATKVKPINVIVITDGQPTDDLESVLCNAASKLDRLEAPAYQVGVQFFQVGNDRYAAKDLKHLDDNMARDAGVRDIVDTVTWNANDSGHQTLTADAMLKVVLGAVVKRLDRVNLNTNADWL